ncbi:calcium-binding protein [Roseibium sp. RKSG952]|uniref:calcium-binding protein n=1 Tax=Roseibium sp. RKSG952 TaxID=2529384 RepID=UPI0012BBF6FE|nr:calcium-binding protein [Roseibium sp. RKSG952]MTH94754.1 hypothetical protein [Roseibium sp. RKSG952]
MIHAGSGNDTLDIGGSQGGWQHARGETGDDVYIIGRDSGSALIHEGAGAGTDTIRFEDLTLSDLAVDYTETQDIYGRSLRMTWDKDGVSGKLHVSNEGNDIERFEFADGTV